MSVLGSIFKNERTLVQDVGWFKATNKIQLEDFSTSSDADDILYATGGSVVVNRNDIRCSPYFNLWNGKRKVNLNRRDNNWNENCHFLARRYDHSFSQI